MLSQRTLLPFLSCLPPLIQKLAPEQIKIAIAKWDPVAGWRENFFRLEGVPGDPRAELCNVMSTMAKGFLDVVSRSNPKFPNRCPFRKVSTSRGPYSS